MNIVSAPVAPSKQLPPDWSCRSTWPSIQHGGFEVYTWVYSMLLSMCIFQLPPSWPRSLNIQSPEVYLHTYALMASKVTQLCCALASSNMLNYIPHICPIMASYCSLKLAWLQSLSWHYQSLPVQFQTHLTTVCKVTQLLLPRAATSLGNYVLQVIKIIGSKSIAANHFIIIFKIAQSWPPSTSLHTLNHSI